MKWLLILIFGIVLSGCATYKSKPIWCKEINKNGIIKICQYGKGVNDAKNK